MFKDIPLEVASRPKLREIQRHVSRSVATFSAANLIPGLRAECESLRSRYANAEAESLARNTRQALRWATLFRRLNGRPAA